MAVLGSQQMSAVARDLRSAGSTGRGLRSKMRRNITVAMTPMKQQVQANAFAIPAKGDRSTGLRQALAKATRIRILTAGANVTVGLIVDGSKMPAKQQSLPGLVEGLSPWRHKTFGHLPWVNQAAHPIVAPAIPSTVLAAAAGVDAAIAQTATELLKGTP